MGKNTDIELQRANQTADLAFNCGMQVQACSSLNNLSDRSPEGLIQFFKFLFSSSAAVIVSDNHVNTEKHKSLSKIGVYHRLGRNPNSGAGIHCWVVSKHSIKAYEASQKEVKSNSKSKKGQVKKLSTTNKKSASKSLTTKTRTAAKSVSRSNSSRLPNRARG